MFNRIALTNVPPQNKNGAILSAAGKQGQWGFLAASDSSTGDPTITPVSAQAHTQKARNVLAPFIKEVIANEDIEGVEDIASGTRVIRIDGRDNLIEHIGLGDQVSGDFSSATPGDAMVLTISGYLTLDGAPDDPGAQSTVVAYFERLNGTSAVVYRTA